MVEQVTLVACGAVIIPIGPARSEQVNVGQKKCAAKEPKRRGK